MANRRNTRTAPETSITDSEPEVENDSFAAQVMGDNAPEGFRRVNPLDGERHYFKASEGATLRGILLGRFARTDSDDTEDKFYFQVRATEPCEHVVTGDGEVLTAPIGAIVQIDERSGLRDLIKIAEHKTPHEVFIRAVERVKLKRAAGTFWRWDVYAREAPKVMLAKVASAVADAADGSAS